MNHQVTHHGVKGLSVVSTNLSLLETNNDPYRTLLIHFCKCLDYIYRHRSKHIYNKDRNIILLPLSTAKRDYSLYIIYLSPTSPTFYLLEVVGLVSEAQLQVGEH